MRITDEEFKTQKVAKRTGSSKRTDMIKQSKHKCQKLYNIERNNTSDRNFKQNQKHRTTEEDEKRIIQEK